MGLPPQQIRAAVEVLTTRYSLEADEASAMLTEWAHRTRLSASTLAAWIVDDGGAAAARVDQVASAA